ncbi:MAG: hypothetical protein GWP14_07685 [Actinobacteria bacterium]|nr:hypothetical protein [Actinomycetota bacterium]
MATVAELVECLTKLVGPLNKEEGLRYGKLTSEVTGICICWMATPQAIKFAHGKGANFIVCHEDLFLPNGKAEGAEVGADFLSWEMNRGRLELLGKYETAVMRLHGSLDKRCVLEAFAGQLGLGQPIVSKSDYVKIYQIEPTSVPELAKRVKQSLDMDGIRVAINDPNRIVSRIGLAWGGMGLFVNVTFGQDLIAAGCEVLIAGETDNVAMRMALEAGVDTIETSHEVSENAGLKIFADELAQLKPDLKVCYYEVQRCWRIA